MTKAAWVGGIGVFHEAFEVVDVSDCDADQPSTAGLICQERREARVELRKSEQPGDGIGRRSGCPGAP